MTAHDAYLEAPYAAQADRDALVEQFEESDDYHTALVEWVLSDDHTRDRFAATTPFVVGLFTGGTLGFLAAALCAAAARSDR